MIRELVDQELKKRQEVVRERSGCFSPSLFGGCFRRQYWNRKDEPKTNPPDARTLRIFEAGHLFEEFVTNLIEDEMETQVEIRNGDIHGFADIVIGDTVYELKTMHSNGFHHMSKPDYNFNEQKVNNILQVMTYCLYLHKPYGKLVYISKDDLCIAEYPLRLEDWQEKVHDELIILRKYWEDDRLPPALPRLYKDKKTGGFKECGYCQWKDRCNQEEGK